MSRYKRSCYDCEWLTDKCKNKKSDHYNRIPINIENKCNVKGKVDNTRGCSWKKIDFDDL